MTDKLLFRYYIQRGDTSPAGLFAQNPSASVYITTNIDLGTAKVLRVSNNPVVVADSKLYSFLINGAITINTDLPRILDLYSTSPIGSYSVGDQVDFQVVFDCPVVLASTDPRNSPTLMLRVAPFGRVSAKYSAGSGTSTIVFLYTVTEVDLQYDVSTASLISRAAPIYQPLRIISTSRLNTLMRKSMNPLIYANLTFPPNVGVNVPRNIHMIGIAPRVAKVSILPNEKDGNSFHFTAGDLVIVVVEMTAAIFVQKNVLSSAAPFLQLVVGRSVPGKAVLNDDFVGINTTVLNFEYLITPADVVSGGLLLHCDCIDYLQRTRIHAGLSTFYATANGLNASLILAHGGLASQRMIEPAFAIDTSIPQILRVSSNATTSIASPGKVLLVSITFTHPVSIFGVFRLILRGEVSRCYAHYETGNNTKVVSFRYLVSFDSGVARVDCNAADSFDSALGARILRFADFPIIVASGVFPVPGSVTSLGLVNPMAIDTGLADILSIGVNDTHGVLPMRSLGITLVPGADYRLVNQYVQENYPVIISAASTIGEVFDAVQGALLQSVAVVSIDSRLDSKGDSIGTYLVSTSSGAAIDESISLGLLQNDVSLVVTAWWNQYRIKSAFDLLVRYDRPVVSNGASLSLNTGLVLNRAFSTDKFATARLVLDKRAVHHRVQPAISHRVRWPIDALHSPQRLCAWCVLHSRSAPRDSLPPKEWGFV